MTVSARRCRGGTKDTDSGELPLPVPSLPRDARCLSRSGKFADHPLPARRRLRPPLTQTNPTVSTGGAAGAFLGWCRCLRVLSATSGCSVTPLPAGISSCPGWTSAAAAGWRCRRSRPRTGPAGSSGGAGSSAPFFGGGAPWPSSWFSFTDRCFLFLFLLFHPRPGFVLRGFSRSTRGGRSELGFLPSSPPSSAAQTFWAATSRAQTLW